MPLKIGIVDFNPDQTPDRRQYPKRIGALLPEDTVYEAILYKNQVDLSKYDMLFLSGSRLSATLYTTMKDQHFPNTDPEYEYIDKMIEVLKSYTGPMFGICFGSQILAYIKGGKLGRLDRTEAGYLSHDLSAEGRNDAVFGHLPNRFYGSHLHQDFVKELPSGPKVQKSDVMASRNGFIHAFRVIDKNGIISYGVQPHPEMSNKNDAVFLVDVNKGWLEKKIGQDELNKTLIVPEGADFEFQKTITYFVQRNLRSNAGRMLTDDPGFKREHILFGKTVKELDPQLLKKLDRKIMKDSTEL